jgi:hypothetical protein
MSPFRKLIVWSLTSTPALWLCGCQRAPSISIVGSFFPVWIFCVVAGILLAALARALFIRANLDKEIKPPVIIYPCIAASCALTLWLLFFS